MATSKKKVSPAKKTAVGASKGQGQSLIADNDVLTVTIKWDEIKPAYQKVLAKRATTVKSDGFRKGKVPAHMVEKMVGRDRLVNATLEQLLPAKYLEVLKKEHKHPVTQPAITPVSTESGQDWQVKIEIAEKPKIQLGSYKKSVVAASKDADQAWKKQQKTEKSTKKPKQDEASVAAQQRDAKLKAIFTALVTQAAPRIPELLVRQQTREELHRLSHTLEQLKMSMDDYLARRGQTFEQLGQEFAATALGQLQIEYVLQAITEDQGITATDAEITKEWEKLPVSKDRKLDDQSKEYLRLQLVRNKTIEWLLAVK